MCLRDVADKFFLLTLKLAIFCCAYINAIRALFQMIWQIPHRRVRSAIVRTFARHGFDHATGQNRGTVLEILLSTIGTLGFFQNFGTGFTHKVVAGVTFNSFLSQLLANGACQVMLGCAHVGFHHIFPNIY